MFVVYHFSFRKMIWGPMVVQSNNDPAVIVQLYLKAVEEHGIAPRLLRTDPGIIVYL